MADPYKRVFGISDNKDAGLSASAPVTCSTAIENVGRMKLTIEPFSDECPIMFEDGRYIQMRYKLDPDGNGKFLISVMR